MYYDEIQVPSYNHNLKTVNTKFRQSQFYAITFVLQRQILLGIYMLITNLLFFAFLHLFKDRFLFLQYFPYRQFIIIRPERYGG